ncbi:hypothetical protein M8C13_33665 [Crossiella sp. SN42]|uniref:hypothetical protein n=1 Tax=Crossiella sp. SN42 TaxID=2944808 RepID=UPI00207CD902|nr:hypothetical protein [Crossiella sp. SN42]MCO1580716.1 hypothetical protein [Crossiella sp. SN42]
MTSTSRRLATALTASALTLGALAATAPSAAAGPIGPCTNLRAFNLEFRTGGDDLRGNSELLIWVTTRHGDVPLQPVWGGFGGNSTHHRSVAFADPNWTANSCEVTGMKIRLVSHPSWPEGPDNWNMDGLVVGGFGEAPSRSYFFSANGAPVKRFTGSDHTWSQLG